MDKDFLILYHGAIVPHRGIEQLVTCVSENMYLKAIILGFGDNHYIKEIKDRINRSGVCNRVILHPAVNQKELWKYIGAADLCFVMIDKQPKSYHFALPNKLFESIQAGIPVLGSDSPEIKKIVEFYQVGFVCDPDNTKQIGEMVEKLRMDTYLYKRFKNNTIRAREDLCWEKEKYVLVNRMKNLMA